MKNLKFRVYIPSLKLITEHIDIISPHYKYLTCWLTSPDEGDPYEYNFDEVVIMQSTGLTDKNGKEIYEGDICVDINQEEFVVNFSDEWSAFLLEKGKDTMVFYPGLQIEIIGNIHENPEIVNP